MTLEQIMISALDIEIEEYEKSLKCLPDPEFSLKHSRIISKAIRIASEDGKEIRKERQQRHRVNVRRVAVVTLVAVLIMVSAAAAFAIAYPEYYMVIKEKAKDWTITFVTDSNDAALTDFIARKGEAPENFVLMNEVSEDGVYTASYDRAKTGEEIIYVQEALSEYSIAGIDSENDYKKIEKLNGVKTIVMKKGDCYTLFWVKDGCSYTLVGNCSLHELKAYAESLK